LSTIRVKFRKGSEVKFISHLDMMNTFQRAARRAGLEAEYSQGFNPQMQMVFGAPLSLGFTSEAEYADLSFAVEYDPKFILERLGRQLPPGLELLGAAKRIVKKNIMADISYTEYTFTISGAEDIEDLAELVMSYESLPVEKVRKGKARVVDIKPMIVRFYTKGNTGSLLGAGGNEKNLNPKLLAKAISARLGRDIEFININRSNQFVERNGAMFDPISTEAMETE